MGLQVQFYTYYDLCTKSQGCKQHNRRAFLSHSATIWQVLLPHCIIRQVLLSHCLASILLTNELGLSAKRCLPLFVVRIGTGARWHLLDVSQVGRVGLSWCALAPVCVYTCENVHTNGRVGPKCELHSCEGALVRRSTGGYGQQCLKMKSLPMCCHENKTCELHTRVCKSSNS